MAACASIRSFLDFGLPVNRDDLAAQPFQIDAVTLALEGQLQARMYQAFARQSLSDAGFRQQIDGALLQKSGPNTGPQVVRRAPFEHDRLDAR